MFFPPNFIYSSLVSIVGFYSWNTSFAHFAMGLLRKSQNCLTSVITAINLISSMKKIIKEATLVLELIYCFTFIFTVVPSNICMLNKLILTEISPSVHET